MEDIDMSGFQKGATYEQIKAYVQEHSGLKVSSLYISQVKRKCGPDIGQNYNLSKKRGCQAATMPAGERKSNHGDIVALRNDIKSKKQRACQSNSTGLLLFSSIFYNQPPCFLIYF